DANAATGGGGRGLRGETRVGARLHEKALVPLGLDGAAQPVARLEQRELGQHPVLASELDHAVGCGEPRDAAAHHGELHRGPRSTRSASMAMKAGWSLAVCAR